MRNTTNSRTERGFKETLPLSGCFIFSMSKAEEASLLSLIAVFSMLVVETSGMQTTLRE